MINNAGTPRLINFFSLSMTLLLMSSPIARGMSPGNNELISFLSCQGIDVTVLGGDLEDRLLACEGARLAIHFLDRMEFATSNPIQVSLLQTLPEVGTNHIGLYDSRTDRVFMLTLAASRIAGEENSAFNVPMEKRIYQSFVSHEVAHAIANRFYRDKNAQLLAHEYLAYVTQLVVMDADLRSEVLDKFTQEPFVNLDELSLIYYQMAPCAFGVKAYLHFLTIENRPAFLHDILSGRIQLGGAVEEWW